MAGRSEEFSAGGTCVRLKPSRRSLWPREKRAKTYLSLSVIFAHSLHPGRQTFRFVQVEGEDEQRYGPATSSRSVGSNLSIGSPVAYAYLFRRRQTNHRVIRRNFKIAYDIEMTPDFPLQSH